MVVCKFFLQGECKYGDSCRFDHQITNTNNPFGGTNQFGSNNVFTSQGTNKATNVDVNTLVKSVHNDMVALENSGQWLLTCYSPFKEKPNFPGFEEHSFEEIRLASYQAQKNNTLEQYKQQLQQVLQDARNKFMALKAPTKEMINILKNIYFNSSVNSRESSIKTNTTFGTTAFGTTNSESIFGNNASQQNNANSMFRKPNQSVFNNNSQNQSIFGSEMKQNTGQNIFQQNSNSIFSNNQSVFGGNNTQSSIFGGQSNPSLFNQNTNTSVFNQGNQSGSIFGQNTFSSPISTATNNSFMGQNSIVQNSNSFQNTFMEQNNSPTSTTTNNTYMRQNSDVQSTPFMGQNQPGFNSIFNHPQTAQPFVQNNPQNSIFSQNITPPSTVFNQPPSTNIFNTQSSTANQSSVFTQSNPTIFGNISTQTSIFGNSGQTVINQPNPEDYNVYSKPEELSAEEINWFKSEDLDINKIPEKPPSYELCF